MEFNNYVFDSLSRREQEDKFYRECDIHQRIHDMLMSLNERELKLVLEYTAMVYKQSEYVNCLKQAGIA